MSQLIDQYLSWFILKNIPGVGNILFRRLIKRFGSPEAVFSATKDELIEIKGMSSKALDSILDPTFRYAPKVNELKAEIRDIERSGFKIATMVDSNYPALLKHIPDPPPYITYIGSLTDIDSSFDDDQYQPSIPPSIAIVGSRDATAYGIKAAETLAYDLASNGFEVISGMAIGIDTAAHRGALRAKGRTIAVLGSGLGKIYPSENRTLFYQIADNGAVISEFKVKSEPEGRHFPMRNRIIAGMALGAVVVEAAKKSGSLITARLSNEYNREVFAVPGDIHSFKSAGTHSLLKQGAKLVANYIDVIEELTNLLPVKNGDKPTKKEVQLSQSVSKKERESLFKPDSYQSAILDILQSNSGSPIHIDVIIGQSGLDVGGVTAALMDLELMGIVKHLPGKMFYKP
ncbi:MAG: DNA-protecting protein DprA [Desulfamplus sp.]|nr:DNA-protecting protein DprA [Desulfamplus sp.]